MSVLGWVLAWCVSVLSNVIDDFRAEKTPIDTSYKRLQTAVQIVSKTSGPHQWGPDNLLGASRPCGPAGSLALLLIQAGDVETNPGPTTTHKQVCHKQIHGRKQTSIRCNMLEHWVHLRWAGILPAQYTDTWTCHLHKESGLRTHTDITQPYPNIPCSKPPTPSQPTHTRPTLLLFPQDL